MYTFGDNYFTNCYGEVPTIRPVSTYYIIIKGWYESFLLSPMLGSCVDLEKPVT